MSVLEATFGTEPRGGRQAMNRRFTLRRGGLFALATGLLFLIAGDRGVTQVASGIDPHDPVDASIANTCRAIFSWHGLHAPM